MSQKMIAQPEWISSMTALLKSVENNLMNQKMITESEWIVSMKALLKSVDNEFIQSYSISIVPEGLKQSNKDHLHPVKKDEEEKSNNKHEDHDDAYMPRVVSMGPRFKGTKEDLLLMEEVKLRCMLSLIHRAGKDRESPLYLDKCCKVIWNLDAEIRASYVADINHIKKPDLAKIMLVDGCFLLELLISKGSRLNNELRCRLTSPPPAPQVLLNEDVLSDLILFENQIPMCVLLELSRTLFPHVFEENSRDRAIRINYLALSIFGYSLPRVQTSSSPHILDVVHFSVNTKKESKSTSTDHDQSSTITATNGNDQAVVVDIPSSNPELLLKRCTSRLRAAGVSIKVAQEKKSRVSCFGFMRDYLGGILLWFKNIIILILGIIIGRSRQQKKVPPREEIEAIKGLDFDFNFDNKGKLVIAQLHIKKSTKATWRNIIAWEHHHKKVGRKSPNGKFTAAALIFDGLICCIADVKLLKEKKIIVDHTKMSNEDLEEFFHTMSFGVDHGVVDSSYVKLVDELNNYSGAFSIMRIPRLIWHRIRWCFQGVIKCMSKNYRLVLSFVAFLTFVQTIYAMVAYHHPAN